jgi:hypothetical protein
MLSQGSNGLVAPAIQRGLEAARFTKTETDALIIIARKTEVKAADLQSAFPGSVASRSQGIRRLLERGVIEPIGDGKRSYRLRLAPSVLTPLLVRELDRRDFLPAILHDSP